jgi:hypothetical protein
MSKSICLPEVPEEQRTPLVRGLLRTIDELAEKVCQQDRIDWAVKGRGNAVLKGEEKREG